MAKLKKGVFPGIARQGKQTAEKSAVTESIEILTGQRGSGNNRALLVSDLVNLDDMKRNALINSAKGGGTNDGGLPITTGGVENPHAPINLTATGGFTFVAVRWDSPTYRGHAYAEVWRSETNSFSEATLIATEVADIFSDSVSMGAEFYYWVRFVNVADVRGPTQGANGVFAKTVESAAAILSEIGGKIESSHLGDFLTSEIGRIPAFDFLLSDIIETEIPALKVNIDEYGIDIDSLREDVDSNLIEIPQLRTALNNINLAELPALKSDIDKFKIDIPALREDVDKNLVEIPLIKGIVEQTLIDIPDIQQQVAAFNDDIPELRQSLTDLSGETSEAKQTADTAKARVEAIEINSDSLARQLIESASINDTNWQSNTTKLYEFESSLKDVSARIEAEFLTKSEANEAIAAAAETIRVEIEATGLALSGDIESTYYTKATTDQAIAEATQLIKSQIEDVEGDSVGALLQSQHYTKVETDSAISFSAEQLKSEIESPTGNSIGALIHSDYYTSAETNNAIAAYGVQLKSDIENPNGDSIGATLQTNYYTSSQVDNALSQAVTNLSSVIESGDNDAKGEITALLDESYYTSAQADNAISQATTQLNSQIETTIEQLDSDLSNDIEQRISTVNSTLTSDYYTSADTDQAIAVFSQFLKSQIEDPQGISLGATLFNDYSTTVDTEKAIARAVFELNSQFDPLAESVIENALANDIANERQQVITANILRTQEAITDESNALAQSLSLIETQFNDSSARITSLDKAVSNSISSSAEKIFQLDSKVESNKTYLEVNYLTKVDTQSAISEATTSLKSEVESGFQSVLTNDYYTSADTDSAITQASTQLQSSIEGVSADLHTNFYTTTETDSAISQATQLLKATIEDPDGNSVGAILFNNYSTKADVNQSISEATTQLNSNIEGAKADIYENVYTKAQADSAISQDTTALKSVIDGDIGELTADLQNNYFTKSATDTAISQATQLLKSEIEDAQGSSIGAVLFNDYSTTTQVEEAIAQATTQLNANIDDLKSDVYENVYTKANSDSAIAGSVTALKSEILQTIEDGDTNLLQTITADLQTNYYTQTEADSAISNATTLLKSAIEDPQGDSLGAELFTGYYTKTDTDSAIAELNTQISAKYDPLSQAVIENALAYDEANSKRLTFEADVISQQQVLVDDQGALAESIFALRSEFGDSQSELYSLRESFSGNILATAAEINRIESSINGVSAALLNNYDTSATIDEAISSAVLALKSEIEDPNGNSVGANLQINYYTKTDTDSTLSDLTTQLNTNINGLSADIYENFYTKVDADGAISSAVTALRSDVESDIGEINAGLDENYYTKADTDSAISQAEQLLKSSIEDPNGDSLGATLFNAYYTKANTDSAISEAVNAMQATIEDPNGHSIGADLQQNYSTTAQTGLAISQATEQLKSVIEDPEGSSLAADIYENFSTTAETGRAISEATNALKSTLDNDIGSIAADLQNNYKTEVETDQAISEATTTLKSEIEDPSGDSLGATLFNEFQTKADAQEASASSEQQLRAVFEPSAQAIIENALAGDLGEERRTLAEADIINRQNVFANEQSALSESITALNSSIDESKANLYQLQTTFADKAQSTAQDLLKLDSDVGNVKSDLVNNYSTSAKVNEAIVSADTALRAAIEDPNGDSVGADLQTNYYTKAAADSAISSATTQLKSAIEDPNGDSVGADLYVNYSTTVEVNQAISSARTALQSNIDDNKAQLETNYYTKTDTDSAISQATTALKSTLDSDIGDLSAGLQTNYYTKTDTDSAISSAVTTLGSEFDTEISNVNSLLQTNYYTKTQADSAISSATTQLKSTIEDPNGSSIGADLHNNFYTKTDTNSAISTANQSLKAAIEDENGNSLGASLQVLGQTVATNEGVFSALWGVKTSVNGLQSSVGLVNDGVDPIFAVKGAKFSIITDQDPTNLTPVFAVSDGKTVINTAIIDEAFIKSLVTDDLLANRVIVGSRFTSPSINYNPSNGARSNNFSIDPNGNMLAKSATLESVTIKDSSGNIVMSSTGAIPSSKITGLGSFATKSSLSFNEVTGKPNFGNLAYLNSIAYDSITGRPSLGPFAGLSKILSSNVTTYIANGAIGSAQIDQAYINQLFGQNASFFGTVYAENIDGDVTDSMVKTPSSSPIGSTSYSEVLRFNVSAESFKRTVTISPVMVEDSDWRNDYFGDDIEADVAFYKGSSLIKSFHFRLGGGQNRVTTMVASTLNANESGTFIVKVKVSGDAAANSLISVNGPVIISAFKRGSTLS